MPRTLALGTALLCALSAGLHPAPVQAAGKELRTALAGELMPLHGRKGKRFVGFEPELAALLGKELGRKIVHVDLEKLEVGSFEAMDRGQAEISINSIAASTATEGAVALTQPYSTLHFRLAAKPGKDPGDLATLTARVGVLDRASRDLVRGILPKAEFKPQRSIQAAVAALMRNEIDYVAHDRAVLAAAIKGTTLKVLEPELGEMPLALAVPADQVDRYNKALTRLAPRIAKLRSKWFPVAKAGLSVDAMFAALPAEWIELQAKGGRMVIPVRCEAATARIELSKRELGWYVVFNLGEDSVEGRVQKIERLGKHHHRIRYLQQSVELRYRPGSKTGEWGKSTELWGGKWRTFADSKHEKGYKAVRVERCKQP